MDAFAGDRPIPDSAGDRLGLGVVAGHLAATIAKLASPEGFVVGIEGPWGSGKSSLVNLSIQRLADQPNAPAVIRFSPWLISSRDQLLKELFRELFKVVDAMDLGGDASAKERKDRLRGFLRRYADHLARVGTATGLAKNAGLVPAPIADMVEHGVEALNQWAASESLEEQKGRLADELRRLPKRIVVFADDLDRLEPSETSEVLRLVRAVADFPNVVYVLCYDRDVLAQNLTSFFHLKEGKGHEFIDKIVQASFNIPRPEAFDLRRMFRNELERAFPEQFRDVAASRDVIDRLMTVIDEEGGRTLTTPRHVVRAINFLRLYLTPVVSRIDLADMVWLQLMRLGNPELFYWVEEYMNDVSALIAGATIREQGEKAQLSKLTSLLKLRDGHIDVSRLFLLRSILPGMRVSATGDKNNLSGKIYEGINSEDVADYVAQRRLGSPQHYRFYFALDLPSRAVADEDLHAFIRECTDDVDKAAERFIRLAQEKAPAGGVLADALLDRLQGSGLSRVPRAALSNLVVVLARGLDQAAQTEGKGHWGQVWIWNRASKVFEASFAMLKKAERGPTIKTIVATGGLGWLTHVFRQEIFNHGVYGDRKKAPEERLLTAAEFSTMRNEMLRRYSTLSVDELMRTPESIHVFYAWLQAGGATEKAVRKWLNVGMARDEDFLKILESWRSWRAVNDQVSYPLNKSVIARFVDYATTKRRLQALTRGPVSELAAKAGELLSVLREKDD